MNNGCGNVARCRMPRNSRPRDATSDRPFPAPIEVVPLVNSTRCNPPASFRRLPWFIASLSFAVAVSANAQSTQPASMVPAAAVTPSTAPATRPAGPVTVESLLPAKKIPFDISDQTIADLSVYIAKSYGFRLIDPFRLQQRVTIKLRDPVSAAEAIDLLDQTLLPLGYTVMREARTNPTLLELRITTTTKQTGLPIHTGGDPAGIPNTDELRTQIISLRYVEPQKAADLIAPVLDAKADITVNPSSKTLIITDTANRIRTAATLIQVLEKQAAEKQAPASGPAR